MQSQRAGQRHHRPATPATLVCSIDAGWRTPMGVTAASESQPQPHLALQGPASREGFTLLSRVLTT